MESNWRFNVWEIGWSNSDVELASRLLFPFSGWLIWTRTGIPGLWNLWIAPLSSVTDRSTWAQSNGLFTAGYPWGFPVEPD